MVSLALRSFVSTFPLPLWLLLFHSACSLHSSSSLGLSLGAHAHQDLGVFIIANELQPRSMSVSRGVIVSLYSFMVSFSACLSSGTGVALDTAEKEAELLFEVQGEGRVGRAPAQTLGSEGFSGEVMPGQK